MEKENCLLTWPVLIIINYDATFNKNLWSVTFCLVLATGLDWFQIALNQFYTRCFVRFIYSQERFWGPFCICLSILMQTETNIVSNKWKSASYSRIPEFWAVYYNISFPWMVEISGWDTYSCLWVYLKCSFACIIKTPVDWLQWHH